METRSGKVNDVRVDVKSPPGKRPFKVYTVVLSTGEEVEIGYKPTYKVGDNFHSEVEFKYGKYKEVKPLGASGATAGVASSAPSGVASMAFPIPKASKETAIIRQNALTNAVNAVINYTDGTPRGSFDEYIDTIISTAYKFAEFSSGQREIRLTKELVDNDD